MPTGDRPGPVPPDLHTLFDHAPFGYLTSTPDWTLVTANETLLDLLDLRRVEVVGHHLSDLLTLAGRIFHETHYAPLLFGEGAVKEVAVDLVGARSERHPVLLTSTLLRDPAGTPTAILTGVADASDRRSYEDELRAARHQAEASEQREQTLRRVLARLAATATTRGIAGVLDGFARRILKATRGTLWLLAADGLALHAVGSSNDLAPLTLTDGCAETDAVQRRRVSSSPDGTTVAIPLAIGKRPIGVFAFDRPGPGPIDAATGATLAILGSQAAQAIERAQLYEQKDLMLGMVAHDLRTPLTTIRGFAEMLHGLHEHDLPPTSVSMLERIETATRHMAELVNDLLDTAVLTSGRLQLSRVVQPVGALVADAAEAHRPAADAKHIELRCHDRSDGATAPVDTHRTVQIVDNLVSNAIKYGPPDTTVDITTEAAGDHVLVSVADEGPGIAADDLAGLFTAHGRTRNRPTGDESSTGLGLAIARLLTEAHGGTLTVTSEVGHGSTFVFTLPRTEPTPTSVGVPDT